MRDAALTRVVMDEAVVLAGDFFAAAICRRRDRRFAFAPADDFNAAMIDCYGLVPPFALCGKLKRRRGQTARRPPYFLHR